MADSKRLVSIFPYSKDLNIGGDMNIAFTVTDAQWEKKMGSIIFNAGGDTPFYGTGNIIDVKDGGKMLSMTLDDAAAPFASATLFKRTNDDDGSTYLSGTSYNTQETAAIKAAGVAGDKEKQNELRNTTGSRMSGRVGKFDETIAPSFLFLKISCRLKLIPFI